jgi:hypothetical protein
MVKMVLPGQTTRWLVAVASLLALFIAGTSIAHADDWPYPTHSETWLQNYVPSGGSIPECARNYHGSYGSLYYTNTNAYMSFGGTCNADNTRPTNWLGALTGYRYNGVNYYSGWVSNSTWTNVTQVTINRYSPAVAYISQSRYWLSDTSQYSYSSFWYQ